MIWSATAWVKNLTVLLTCYTTLVMFLVFLGLSFLTCKMRTGVNLSPEVERIELIDADHLKQCLEHYLV